MIFPSFPDNVDQDLANFSIGMTEAMCVSANGTPTWKHTDRTPVKLLRFHPDPERIPSGNVLVYERVGYCVVAFFDETGYCEYIYVCRT